MGAGSVIGWLRWRGRRVGSAWRAYVGWLIMAPIVIGCVFLGRFAVIVLFTLLALVGLKEFARATGLYRDWLMTGVVYIGTLGIGITCLVNNPNTGLPGWYGLFVAMPAFVIAAILIVPIVRNRAKGQLQQMALAIVGFIYIGWMFGHLSFLANSQYAYGYVLFLLFAVEINDMAAFACGKCFGKRPLRNQISPTKTLEGSLGALAVSMVLPWFLWFSFPHFTPRDLLLTGLIVGIGGQLGDLSISVIKRDIGIKDIGSLLPGHGGVLDRIDSLIYTAPLFFHTAGYFHNLQ